MKKIIALILALLSVTSFVACGGADNGVVPTGDPAEIITPMANAAGKLTPSQMFTPKSDDDKIMTGTYTKVSALSSSYIKKSGNDYVVSYKAPQFAIEGIDHPNDNNGRFYRLDYEKSRLEGGKYYENHINGAVAGQASSTAGAAIRFRTNASSITISATMTNTTTSGPHSYDRSQGFDVYVGTGTDRVWCSKEEQKFYDSQRMIEKVDLPDGYKEVLVLLPCYAGILDISFTMSGDAEIAKPLDRVYDEIVIYGSSITQGGCVSRPGTLYPAVLSRMLNTAVRNLGFSSGALLEMEMANYIAGIGDVSAIIMDNDGNSFEPDIVARQYDFYKKLREAYPDVPIIFMTMPIYDKTASASDKKDRDAIYKIYMQIVKEGDKNVYFLDGLNYFPEIHRDAAQVDHVHITDFGSYNMAMLLYDTLAPILEAKYGA